MRKNRNYGMRSVLAAGVLSVALSVCLCAGSTFAWFQDSLGSENTIEIGSFGVDAAMIPQGEEQGGRLSSAHRVFSPGTYQLSVSGEGNTLGCALIYLEATQSNTPAQLYRTRRLSGGIDCTYELVLNEETAVSIDSIWGTSRQGTLLEDGASRTYGVLPPAEEKEQTERTDREQTGSEQGAPSAAGKDNTAVNKENFFNARGEENTTTTGGGKPETPAATGGDSKPTATDGDSKPAATDGDSKPAATDGDSKPAATDGDSKPAATDGDSKPTATDGDSKPAATDGDSKPAATDGDSKPAATDGDSKPTATDGDNKPAATDGDSKPAATGGDSKPAATGGDSKPTATDGDSKPAATSGDSKSTATGGDSKSTATGGDSTPTASGAVSTPTTGDSPE